MIATLPGVDLEELRSALVDMHSRVQNARATTGTSVDVYNAYIRWVNEAAEHLGRLVPARTLEQLVLTPRYWSLQTHRGHAPGDPAPPER